MGYKYSTRASLSISVADMTIPEMKYTIVKEAEAKVDEIFQHFNDGELSEDERYNCVIEIWDKATDDVIAQIQKSFNSLPDDECRKIISSLLNSFEIAQIDKSHIKAAIERKNFKDFEDCLQDECASSFTADFIITRDKNDFLNAKTTPLLPTEFLHAV